MPFEQNGHFVAVNQFVLKTVEFITLVHQPSRSVAALTWFRNDNKLAIPSCPVNKYILTF
jgi:hypothetical protein